MGNRNRLLDIAWTRDKVCTHSPMNVAVCNRLKDLALAEAEEAVWAEAEAAALAEDAELAEDLALVEAEKAALAENTRCKFWGRQS